MLSLQKLGGFGSFQNTMDRLRGLRDLYKNIQGNGLKNGAKNSLSLSSQLQVNTLAKAQSSVAANLTSQTNQNAVRNGNTTTIKRDHSLQGTINSTYRGELAQDSKKVVQGKVNGKPVYLNEERNLKQTTTASRNTALSDQGASLQNITRNVEKNGNKVQADTHIATTSSGTRNVGTQATSRTETDLQVRRFDQAGNLIGGASSRRAITAYQEAASTQNRTGEATRDISQAITRSAEKNGNSTVQTTRVDTTDVVHAIQNLDTASQSRNTTVVENLDADGNVLSASRSTQLANSQEDRTIETNREANSSQVVQTHAGPNGAETKVNSHYNVSTNVSDRTHVAGTVQNLNGDDVLVSERNFERNSLVTTDEDIKGERQLRTAVTRADGGVRAETELNGNEHISRSTQATYESGGAVSTSSVETEAHMRLSGGMVNEVSANGTRNVALDIEEGRHSRTEAVAVGPNGQGRETTTVSNSQLSIEGGMQFNPATGEVGSSPKAAPGAVVVSIGTYTGVNASFKMDNGELTFDFTVERGATSVQESAVGQVVNGDVVNGKPGAQSESASASTVRIQGKVVSSVDEAGNRVLTLSGNVVSETAAGRAVHEPGQGQPGVQLDRSRTELEVSGELKVNRSTTTDGNTTTTKATSEASMQVNRVTEQESQGVNVRSLAPMSANAGVQAGLSASNGSLRFNFGAFSFGVSFLA